MAFLKSIWKANSKHKKLSEEQALQIEECIIKEDEAEKTPEVIENEDDVLTFKLKYLGSTVVEKISGDNINTEAVKNIIKVAKAGRKKLQRVNIAISLKGISVTDLQGNDVFKVSIYRISNCSTDTTHRQVFSFVSTDESETMECHAFICSKRKMTETVTLAVAHAFSTAYEAWRILPTTKEFAKNADSVSATSSSPENSDDAENQRNNEKTQAKIQDLFVDNDHSADLLTMDKEEKLIDFDDDEPTILMENPFVLCHDNFNSKWVCFDDDFVTDFANNAANNIRKSDMIFA